MSRFRREALRDFVETSDGTAPPAYIGRERILRKIEGYANAT